MPVDWSKYPKNWKSEIRPAILARANNCCEECGVPNGMPVFRGMYCGEKVFQTVNGDLFKEDGSFIMHDSEYCCIEGKSENQQAIKIVLTVAHLDHDLNNNSSENLKALCQLHHLRHDKSHHMKNSRATNEKKKGLQKLF